MLFPLIPNRIHYGKFIAEAKFQEKPELYSQLIREKNSEEILRLLTNEEVEQRLLKRVCAEGRIDCCVMQHYGN